MRIVFMGTPEFAVPSLERLVLNQYQVVAVYTQPDKVGGRGRSRLFSPVKRAAMDGQLPIVQPINLRGAEVVAQLASFLPDIIVLVAFGQILPPSVLAIPHYGCLNVHPSLLPKFRGASPIAAALLAGSEFTGVSLILMERGLDTGPVLARAAISISPEDTTGSLTAKLSLIAAPLLLEVLARLVGGELAAQPQNEAEATYSGEFSKQDGEVDWHLSAVEIWRRVRAFHPWPGCYSRWQGKRLKIIKAVPLSEVRTVEVGQVVALDKEGVMLGVNTGQGILGLLELQLEGRQSMAAAEFLRGQRQFIGSVLPS